jgi:hypothetical protein
MNRGNEFGRKLTSLAIFWRNDKPEGFGVEFHDPEEAQEFAGRLAWAYDMFKAGSKKQREEFLAEVAPSQLAEAAKMKNDRSPKGEALFLVKGPMNVFILEQEKRLDPVDNFNGCVFTYEL